MTVNAGKEKYSNKTLNFTVAEHKLCSQLPRTMEMTSHCTAYVFYKYKYIF